jgi:hypothetical protein
MQADHVFIPWSQDDQARLRMHLMLGLRTRRYCGIPLPPEIDPEQSSTTWRD